MSEHTWRGDPNLIDPRREYLREHMPNGRDGLVIQDVDLVLRRHGPKFMSDDIGTVRLVELKEAIGSFGAAQRRTFGLLDDICKGHQRYDGFYVIWSATRHWETEPAIFVNGHGLTHQEFREWLHWRHPVPCISPYEVPESVMTWHVAGIEPDYSAFMSAPLALVEPDDFDEPKVYPAVPKKGAA
jgi:hypothetical protein